MPKIGALATPVTSGNLTLAEPAGIAAGDLMIACIAYRNGAAFTVPGDWTLVATQQSSGDIDATNGIASGVMMWCLRGGSAPTLTFNRTAGNMATGRIIAYTGAKQTSPYDTGSANTLAVASATVTTGTFSTAEADELIVAMVSAGDNLTTSAFDAATDPGTQSNGTDTTTAPTAGTWRERADDGTNTGADGALAIADAIRATAGATGTIQATVSASARHVMIAGAWKMAPVVTPPDDGAYSPVGPGCGFAAMALAASLVCSAFTAQVAQRAANGEAGEGLSPPPALVEEYWQNPVRPVEWIPPPSVVCTWWFDVQEVVPVPIVLEAPSWGLTLPPVVRVLPAPWRWEDGCLPTQVQFVPDDEGWRPPQLELSTPSRMALWLFDQPDLPILTVDETEGPVFRVAPPSSPRQPVGVEDELPPIAVGLEETAWQPPLPWVTSPTRAPAVDDDLPIAPPQALIDESGEAIAAPVPGRSSAPAPWSFDQPELPQLAVDDTGWWLLAPAPPSAPPIAISADEELPTPVVVAEEDGWIPRGEATPPQVPAPWWDEGGSVAPPAPLLIDEDPWQNPVAPVIWLPPRMAILFEEDWILEGVTITRRPTLVELASSRTIAAISSTATVADLTRSTTRALVDDSRTVAVVDPSPTHIAELT